MIPGQESPIIYAEDLKDVYVKLNFPFPNPNGGLLAAQPSGGAILTFHISAPGTGYSDTLGVIVTGGTGAGALFDTTTTHQVFTVGVTTPGTGFIAESTYAATGGTGTEAQIVALTVEIAVPETADVNLFIYRRREGGRQ